MEEERGKNRGSKTNRIEDENIFGRGKGRNSKAREGELKIEMENGKNGCRED